MECPSKFLKSYVSWAILGSIRFFFLAYKTSGKIRENPLPPKKEITQRRRHVPTKSAQSNAIFVPKWPNQVFAETINYRQILKNQTSGLDDSMGHLASNRLRWVWWKKSEWTKISVNSKKILAQYPAQSSEQCSFTLFAATHNAAAPLSVRESGSQLAFAQHLLQGLLNGSLDSGFQSMIFLEFLGPGKRRISIPSKANNLILRHWMGQGWLKVFDSSSVRAVLVPVVAFCFNWTPNLLYQMVKWFTWNLNKLKYQEEWSGVFGLIQFAKNGNPCCGQIKQANASGLKFMQSPDVCCPSSKASFYK